MKNAWAEVAEVVLFTMLGVLFTSVVALALFHLVPPEWLDAPDCY